MAEYLEADRLYECDKIAFEKFVRKVRTQFRDRILFDHEPAILLIQDFEKFDCLAEFKKRERKMSADLSRQIENFLLHAGGWISGRDIAIAFGIEERALRRTGGRPGLCSEFAISHSRRGFKHVRNASDAEFSESYRQSRKHAIAEMVSARKRKSYRERLLTEPPDPILEVSTGQSVMRL
jgi:hypothetical protein